ncbi:GrpB family protein [Lacihabitans sp. CCS-44]|uniref:GrpB family protein n=1 Tax=Lacihabitans sp. CCS-44 TaxID=2487331 RepID=UPI0020CBB244|nr:GrpB family protein [Lacihabitans sp. CCS-44]MCP9754101.1 GrpB family protein [Lacihabitans sp. CCS-44]
MLLKKYTSDWIENFIDLKNEIDKSLIGLKYRIEHVGSTSVPGLDSKNIIDIDIIYESESEFNKIKAGLIEIGYYHNGNQGIEQREVFKRIGKTSDPTLDKISHHLYVCPSESKALERHLLSRDYLRKNDWARLEYQEMKYELADKAAQDKKRYAELKELKVNDFIDSIIEKEREDLYKNLEQPILQT